MLVHKHFICRAEVKKPPMKEEELRDWMQRTVKAINMKILDGPHCKYLDVVGNRGLTGVTIIETSHIAMHVWDESDPALMQLDIYTCGPIKLGTIFEMIDEFEPIKIDYKFLDREHDLTEVLSARRVDPNDLP